MTTLLGLVARQLGICPKGPDTRNPHTHTHTHIEIQTKKHNGLHYTNKHMSEDEEKEAGVYLIQR